jgi:hypothetical protein
MALRCIVRVSSPRPYRLKYLFCSNHTTRSSQKQIAKAKNPRIVASSSSKVFGTSRETTSSVTAKPKTASEKPSIRETSLPRQENPPLCAYPSVYWSPTRHPYRLTCGRSVRAFWRPDGIMLRPCYWGGAVIPLINMETTFRTTAAIPRT